MWSQTYLIIASYFLGAIPIGLLITKLKGIDIRSVGSGNIGATNVFRAVGKNWGIITFIGDALKGFIPTYFFPIWAHQTIHDSSEPILSILCGCTAIAGHNWPIYLKFKGGKGVATSAGFLVGIAPQAVGIGCGIWILLFAISRYVSVASIAASITIIIVGWVLYSSKGLLLPTTLTILGFVVIWRHRSNIVRLKEGTEHRFATSEIKKEKDEN
ncbi:MAG: glycerol-3-phosphate 1-O-acyltransferase PlsY [Kiritimatiellae bacterium]|nr:glycerol-3-phosphate 1-O-acyltransferase PlsY [Kiritimatiellia bacterium]